VIQASAADHKRLVEIERALGECAGTASAPLSDVLPRMRTLLRTDKVGAFSLAPAGSGLAFDMVDLLGIDPARYVAVFGRMTRSSRAGWQGIKFDPLRPQPKQRNRVDPHMAGDGSRRAVRTYFDRLPEAREGFAAIDAIGDQVRTLVCDGPRLLAWVGAIREDAFTEIEAHLLERLIPALRRRLTLHRRLGPPGLAAAALPAALDAISSAAFLAALPARVVLANAAGRVLLERDGVATVDAVRVALAGGRGPFDAYELTGHGLPRHALVIARREPADAVVRASALAARMALTQRQRSVLGLVARGLANKDIAIELGVSVGAIELHVGALLDRAGCESRAELVAKVWSAPP
jgi:DNA-binding CsgD family transcriptional regulator